MITHFVIFYILDHLKINPYIANLLAFIVAFQVSFWGHFAWSFQESDIPRNTAMLRFFIVAIVSFLINELMLAGLLEFTQLSHSIDLLIVLFTVAGGTFLFSKFWAFSHSAIKEK